MPSTATAMLDGLSTSVAIKAPCVTVATSNITLSGLQTISGVSVAEGDRVLCVGQTDAKTNGIYVASTGSWSRALDADGNRDLVRGTRVMVRANSIDGIEYELTTANPIVIGTSNLVFELRYGANATYSQSAFEAAAGVVPVNTGYLWGNVLRYGAVGINSDDTTAFQNAINSGHKVVVPIPSVAYRITQPLTIAANQVLCIEGEGWGWTTGGAFDGGCWINFDCATTGVALFTAAAKVEGFDISKLSIKLSRESSNHAAFDFAEILQGNFDAMRIEGASTALDTNIGFRFRDPTLISGTYSGNINISRINFTGIQRCGTLPANCTTFRIRDCEHHGNNPSSASTIAWDIAANAVGVEIMGGMFQGWSTAAIRDAGTGTTVIGPYFESNTLTADFSNATFPKFIPGTIVSGGGPVFPSDRTKAAIYLSSRNFMVDDARLDIGLGVRERYRAFNMSEYQTYTPTFSANNSMTYTSVTTQSVAGSTTLLKYTVTGNVVEIDFMFEGTVGGTPSSELRFTLPPSFNLPTGRVRSTCVVFNNSVWTTGAVEIQSADGFARVMLESISGSWTAGTASANGRIRFHANV